LLLASSLEKSEARPECGVIATGVTIKSMAIQRGPDAVSLLDLLDRMLDNGIVIDAWERIRYSDPKSPEDDDPIVLPSRSFRKRTPPGNR